MGAQSGIFFFDMRPIGDAGEQVANGLAALTPDGVTLHAEDGLAMAYGAFDAWQGESGGAQPFRSPAGFVTTWDGRLDNRRDLECRVGCAPVTDCDLALHTFTSGGIAALRDLVGDWAMVIWDRGARTLHFARDYMGPRPLYYLWTPQWLAWSTCLGELALRTGRADAVSEPFVAAFVARRTSVDVTPYQGIRAVPAATCVSFSADGRERRQRFWDLAPALIRYRDRRQYEDHLRSLWADAVGARLNTARTVWTELSGGLDSSSVVCMADVLVRSGRVPAPGIRPVSHATLQSPEGDERRFIAEVEARVGVPSEIVGVEQHQACHDPQRDWITPFALAGVGLACVQRVRNAGGRIVLSGRSGDAVMGAQFDNSVAVFDDFTEAGVVRMLAGVRAWSRACRVPFIETAARLLRAVTVERSRPQDAPGNDERLAGSLGMLTAPLREMLPDPAAPDASLKDIRPTKRAMARMILAYADGARLLMPSQPPDLFYTYPFTHRPLIEFVLAIPGGELSAPGNPRNLMRRAFAGIVPDRILRRTSKGNYPPAMLRAMRPAVAGLRAESLEVVRRGWIDPANMDRALRELVDGTNTASLAVRSALRLEEWLSTRHRRATALSHTRKEVRSHDVRNA